MLRPLAVAVATAASVALAAPAAAAVPNGTYKGSTDQNRTVRATVEQGKIKKLSFSVLTRCGIGGSNGSSTDVLHVEHVRLKASGAFKVSSKGDSSNGYATYDLVGKVTRSRIHGSIEQFFRGGCQTFELGFSAKRR